MTGASGYLGTALCSRLTRKGLSIIGVSRQDGRESSPGMKWVCADLTKPGASEKLLKDNPSDAIIHLAGLPDGRRDLDLVGSTFEANSAATVDLLTSAVKANCKRFVYCASMEEPDPRAESPLPNSPYAASKWVGTAYCRMFSALYGLPVTVLRTYLTYGPGLQAESKLIPYVITSLLSGEAPKLSSGRRMVDVIYIDDVVAAFEAALDSETATGEIIEVGSGRQVSIRQIADMIASIINNGVHPDLGALPDRPMEMTPTADIESSRRLLGWQPRISLEEGLRRTVEWYRNQPTREKG